MSTGAEPGARPDLATVLAAAGGKSRWRRALAWLAAGVLALLGAYAYLALRGGEERSTERYLTAPVTRGVLTVTVSATGNLHPTNQVDVGSELSGTVEAVLVEENDLVRKGQVLARLDVTRLQAQVMRSQAQLASAQARVHQAQAALAEARANLARLQEVARLSGGKVPSRAEMETAQAAVAKAEADGESATASVADVRAALSADETSLRKATIRSPIEGIVLSRKVEPGQTVAASLQAPVLFTLAEDLTRMELQVDVDEADVGAVREGQDATFGVDAYPRRRYTAVLTRVGFGSQTKEGVVSYPALLRVDNSDLSLRPGMTATASIVTARRDDALLVPNAALRFEPTAVAVPQQASRSLLASLLPRPPRPQRPQPTAGGVGTDRRPQVWVLRDGAPEAVALEIGVSDGRMTEVLGGALEPGMQVITEAVTVSQ